MQCEWEDFMGIKVITKLKFENRYLTVDKSKLNKYDEATIRVVSQLGQKTGEFFWPLTSIGMLLKMNREREGFYFMTDAIKDYCFITSEKI